MKSIHKAWLIQIEITNVCTHGCANCTRFVGHHRKPYFMDIDTVAKAIESLEGFKGGIGIMGGEPTRHPRFREICALLREKVPAHRCGLWTSGYKWDEYKALIKDTFRLGVYYNDHSDETQKHQPMLVAIDEVVEDKSLMWELIDNCWVQEKWSPSINPKGGFFCECAASADILYDGPGGFTLEKGWWNKTQEQFSDQIKRYCPRCSGALPMIRYSNKDDYDLMSKGNVERLTSLGSPKVLKGKYILYNEKITREMVQQHKSGWKPWNYLSGSARKVNLKMDEVWLTKGFHGIRRYLNKLKGLLKTV